MTDLRKAAEMALDALEADREHITYESAVYSAALALRQALAQPEQECNRKSDRQLLKEALRSLNHLSQNAIKSKTDLILSLDYAKQSINEIGVRIREPEEISDYHEGWEEGFKAGLAKAQPEQEPVAWIYKQNEDEWVTMDWQEVENDATGKVTPLYTVPPSKPWVSLTDEEIWEWFESNTAITRDGALRIARAIEAKLKEKNT